MKKIIVLILLMTNLLVWSFNNTLSAQTSFPGKHWEQYQDVEEAGFSKEKLDGVRAKFDSTQAASLLVVYKGKVLLAIGENTRRFMTHSIRKGFMNALYGIYINNGQLNLDYTLESLGIDDKTPLTDQEKQATIRHLLSARSGIYLPAAYSPKGMAKRLPARGTHAPGNYWYYNNWDFNVLSTIFEKQIGNKVIEDFYEKIAQPLSMEDFRLRDGFYRYEPEKSEHPAYLFKMSARDMARFGWLYLNKGKWNNQQLIPADWVEKSTSCVSKKPGTFGNRYGYGYLWWVSNEFEGQHMYYASGAGGHRIIVLPEAEMVVVHRVNTYEGKSVADDKILKMVEALLAAKVGKPIDDPATELYDPAPNIPAKPYRLTPDIVASYLGSYQHPFLGTFTIREGPEGLELATDVGTFRLFAISQDQFFPEDIGSTLEMIPAPDEEKKWTVHPVYGPERSLEKVVFYY